MDAGPYYETEEYVEHSDSSAGIINTVYHQARKWMLRYKLRLIRKHAKATGYRFWFWLLYSFYEAKWTRRSWSRNK